MLKSSELIGLPYPADLTQAGIAIACRRLASSNRAGEPGEQGEFSEAHRLHLEVAAAGVALAFRRYLLDERIPFQYLENSPFTDPQQVTLVLGGRRCEIATSLISDHKIAGRLLADPKQLLETSLQVPTRLQPSDLYNGGDLAVFACALGRLGGERSELMRNARVGEPFLCHHSLPKAWREPSAGRKPGQVSFRYAGDSALLLDLYGIRNQQEHCFEQIALQPHTWVTSQYQYRSLGCLHTTAIPTARVELQSPAHRSAYTIMPLQWRNVWVYGQAIILAGYLAIEEIWAYWRAAPAGRPGGSLELEIPVAKLHPLPLFLKQVAAR
jgi:hypothetical protein